MRLPTEVTVSLVLVLGLAAPVAAQSGRRVVIDAQVLDLHGRAVPGLAPGDFEVLDNGQPQRVAELHYDNAPLDLVILQATGDPAGISALRQTIGGLSESLRTLRHVDRVRLARLSASGNAVLDSAAEPNEVAGRILRAGAGTLNQRLFDGIRSAAGLFRPSDSAARRRVILLLVDSWESGSQTTVTEATTAALRADATVSAFVLSRARARRASSGPNLALQGTVGRQMEGQWIQPVVSATGGEIIWQDNGRRSRELIGRLAQRYLISYPAPDGDRFRTLAVTLRQPVAEGRQVRARRGYYPPAL